MVGTSFIFLQPSPGLTYPVVRIGSDTCGVRIARRVAGEERKSWLFEKEDREIVIDYGG